MAEHVVLFAGPVGAGKTTAIESLSDIEVVRTEAANTERGLADKATTTVALDYGEITVDDHDKVRLYGVPGQRRFDFMWTILKERARGLLLLVHNDAPDSVDAMLEYLAEFGDLGERGAIVVGVSRMDLGRGPSIDDYAEALEGAMPGRMIPIFSADPRSPEQMRILLLTLIASIEARTLFSVAQQSGQEVTA